MEWWEIIGGVVVFVIAVFIGINNSDFHRKRYHNDSWKERGE